MSSKLCKIQQNTTIVSRISASMSNSWTKVDKLSTVYEHGYYKHDHGADEEAQAEDDETDAVDDSRSKHPFVHRLLLPVTLTAQSIISAQSRLQQVTDVIQNV